MDNRPIGVFDSGLGGLTSVLAIKNELPSESIIYFGDTARTPYGSKSPDTIKEFSKGIAGYLIKKDVKMIVIACNTVTAIALETLKHTYPDIPILGVIEPTARKVAKEAIQEVGIIGTKVTIESKIYEDNIKKYSDTLKTKSLACPALVPLIEEGIIENEIMDLTIKYYMDDFVNANNFKHLILGCTHYPLVSQNIKRLYPELSLYSSSKEVAKEVKSVLSKNDILAEENDLQDKLYASDLSDNFLNMTKRLFGEENVVTKLKKLEIG